MLKIRTLRQRLTHVHYNILIADSYKHFDTRCVYTVDIVLLHQLERCGNNYRTELMKRCYEKPDLRTLLQNEHDYIALFNPFIHKEVYGTVTVLFNIFKSKTCHVACVVRPYESKLLRLYISPSINNVKAEVEVIGYVYFKILFHVLVAVKFKARTKSLYYLIHLNLILSVCGYYSLITVKNLVLPSTAA